MSKQTDFFKKYANSAMEAQNLYGIPASITLAQGALESSWGQSGLTVKANNFFGIKDFPNDYWVGEQYVAMTKEQATVGYYSLKQPFRKYKTPADSFADHARFLLTYDRYKPLFSLDVNDYEGWAKGLKSAGYATDNLYPSKLINMIKMYNLTQYDKLAPKKKIIKLVFICVVTTGLTLGLSYYKKWLNEPKNIVFAILIGILAGVLTNELITQIKKR